MANRVTRRKFLQWLGLAPMVVPVALEAMTTAAPTWVPVSQSVVLFGVTRITIWKPGYVLRAADLGGECSGTRLHG